MSKQDTNKYGTAGRPGFFIEYDGKVFGSKTALYKYLEISVII